MAVEDHPLDYADFEGIIPKGQYGGGTVMVWDRGTFESLGGDPARDLKRGKLHFELQGEKLKGEWTLIRMRHGESGREWLLLKSGKSVRKTGKKRDAESAISGRTMKRIAEERDTEWDVDKGEKPDPVRKKLPELRAEKPDFVSPMKAKLVESPPRAGDWKYEIKFDGYRALAVRNGKSVRLLSRNERSLAAKFPDVADAIAALEVEKAVLDGEIVALDGEGRPSFQLLQRYERSEERPPLRYYLFDLLNLEGGNTRPLPLAMRKDALRAVIAGGPEILAFSDNIEGAPEDLLEEIRRHGLEGVIGKRADSQYEPGKRGGAWIKLKVLNEQEFVIGGYTRPQGARKYFGALIVGYYEKRKLLCAAKVGTGFSQKRLKELHAKFQRLRQDDCPFANLPTARSGRTGQGITKAGMRRCVWLKPELVCQVRFTEWTGDGGLRHPVFLGMREDKPAREVRRESAR
jgi:bifunctional non-homologous end joining protein LigD